MKNLAFIAAILFSIVCKSQDNVQASDSIIPTNYYVADTNHTPKKATVFSAVLPGMGQVYNDIHKPLNRKSRLWWKLPLIYGGMGTGIYFFIENNQQYHYFRNKRLDLFNSGNSYITTDYGNFGDAQLKSITDQYERWRGLSAIGTLAVYLLNIIDANVEGTLIHFDCSDDLSFRLEPTVISFAQNQYPGASIHINF